MGDVLVIAEAEGHAIADLFLVLDMPDRVRSQQLAVVQDDVREVAFQVSGESLQGIDAQSHGPPMPLLPPRLD